MRKMARRNPHGYVLRFCFVDMEIAMSKGRKYQLIQHLKAAFMHRMIGGCAAFHCSRLMICAFIDAPCLSVVCDLLEALEEQRGKESRARVDRDVFTLLEVAVLVFEDDGEMGEPSEV